MMKYSVLQKMS